MILTPKSTPTSQLTWDRREHMLVGEISSTRGFGRVYDDACDEGLTLVSATTGREVVYVVDRTDVRDGEIVAWDLVPARPAERHLPRVRLFND